MSFKREREDTPDLLKDHSIQPDASPIKKLKTESDAGSDSSVSVTDSSNPKAESSDSDAESEEDDNAYRLDFGDYEGQKLDELYGFQLAEIAEDDELVASNPTFRQALIDWSNNIYKISTGRGYYDGVCLGEAPISWINSWIYATGHAYNDPRTRVALKYHFLDRQPEMPGSKWVFTYGKHAGESLDNLVDDNRPMKYDQWTKDEGIGTTQNADDYNSALHYDNDGRDDVADALVFNERRKIRKILADYPNIHNYQIPWYHHTYRYMYIQNLTLEQVFDLNEWVQKKVMWGKEIHDELVAAVGWRMALHDSIRWNWRGRFEDRHGRKVWVPADLGKNLYPSTEVEAITKPYQPRY